MSDEQTIVHIACTVPDTFNWTNYVQQAQFMRIGITEPFSSGLFLLVAYEFVSVVSVSIPIWEHTRKRQRTSVRRRGPSCDELLRRVRAPEPPKT